MRETLYIRLRAADPGAPTAYCIARPQTVASFPVLEAPLDTVLLQAAQRRVVLIVPSADVRLTSVQIPARQAAKVLQAAPYMLEDQLAEDVDSLHFALGLRQASGRWPVAVVARSRMAEWLALFQAHGLRPDAILPDVLALPVPSEDQFSVLLDGEQVLVRSGIDSGFVCQREDLEFCLSIADPDKRRTLRVLVLRDESYDLSRLGWPVVPLPGHQSPLEALLQHLRVEQAIDLLQGSYSQRKDLVRLLQPWRAAAMLAAVAILLGAGLHAVQAWRLGSELAALEAANIARYQAIFPAETRIVDLGAQLDQQLSQFGGATGSGLLPLLEVLAQGIAATPGLNLQSLQYREGALYAGLGGTDLQLIDRLKGWFEQPRAARLEVQSANAGAEGVQIRIRLTPAAGAP